MSFIDKYNCILCKYNKYNKGEDSCFNHQEQDEYGYPIEKCNSLSNIYYALIKIFPFKQIDDIRTEIAYRKEEKDTKEMDDKYGDCGLENDDIKFVWGVKSWDDLSGSDANLFTMNDIDITYDKKKQEYMLDVETAYAFKNHAAECNYLKDCLKAFTKYMDDNGLKKNKPYDLFFSNPCTSMTAKSVEELYTKFKIFVDGFCSQDTDMECKAFIKEKVSKEHNCIGLIQNILNEYFDIPNDVYAYNLTRVKDAFNVGTMSLEDFEEFNEETTRDLAECLVEEGCGWESRCR